MAISYNTGATATNQGGGGGASQTLTIPAGVLAGDVMLLAVNAFSNGTTPALTVASTGTAFTQIGATQKGGTGSGYSVYGGIYYAVAAGTDAGKVITASVSGGGAPFVCVALAAYTGVSSSAPVDVSGGANAGISPLTFPAETTGVANDWAVYLAPFSESVNASFTGPAGTTSRQSVESGGIGCAIWDSAGGVGGAGTSIGGAGETLSSTAATVWLTGFTVGLAPAAVVPPVPSAAPPQIPHPLWHELLEVAYGRADWQAQGAATPVTQTWRLMDGVNGRPGTGSTGTQPPATATGSLTNINGTGFYVTQGGMWLQGYWWYVCPAGGQSVAPQKFCLWSCVNGGGQVVPGSTVTSGTLSTGWNWVPLAQPVQLAIWGQYMAATGITGTYPVTSGQFSSGGPYSAGITNGPLSAFSDNNGSNPAPYSFGNGATSGASAPDPTLTQPANDSNAGDNFWLDVQVTNSPPAGYAGSFRLWPDMADADFNSAADSAVNYVVGTEIILSQPCVVNAIWYYLPAGTVQFATSADIWRVRDGVRVATQPNPIWCKPGGGKATSSSGHGGTSAQWVYAQLPGLVYLAAGDYRVSVYNGNASPDGWSTKRLGYWEAVTVASGGTGTPDGTYQHSPPGAAGITNGPLYAPPTPLASAATDYSTGNTEPGQSVFAVGPPNQFPNTYVGQSSTGIYTGPALFQNYWVDLEVTPASVFTPDAPDLPQRLPHPLYSQLLEVAGYRMDGGASAASARQAGSVPALMAARTEVVSRVTGRVIRR